MTIPFVGPSYDLKRRKADVQRSVNLMPTKVENASGKNAMFLKPVPGLDTFSIRSVPTAELLIVRETINTGLVTGVDIARIAAGTGELISQAHFELGALIEVMDAVYIESTDELWLFGSELTNSRAWVFDARTLALTNNVLVDHIFATYPTFGNAGCVGYYDPALDIVRTSRTSQYASNAIKDLSLDGTILGVGDTHGVFCSKIVGGGQNYTAWLGLGSGVGVVASGLKTTEGTAQVVANGNSLAAYDPGRRRYAIMTQDENVYVLNDITGAFSVLTSIGGGFTFTSSADLIYDSISDNYLYLTNAGRLYIFDGGTFAAVQTNMIFPSGGTSPNIIPSPIIEGAFLVCGGSTDANKLYSIAPVDGDTTVLSLGAEVPFVSKFMRQRTAA